MPRTAPALTIAAAVAAAALGAAPVGAAGPAPAAGRTIWDGIFTEAQAARGKTLYSSFCARCHGVKLDGAAAADQPVSPAISGEPFLRFWSSQQLQPLHEFIRTNMPLDDPGRLDDSQSIDVLAYILSVNGAKPGDRDLSADPAALAGISITEGTK